MSLDALDIVEIERCIEGTECGVRLVPVRLLRRVIKLHRHISGVGFDVPHATSYVLAKDELLAIVDEQELGHPADALPDSVILLVRPEADAQGDRTDTTVTMWRHAFHASIHRELEQQLASGLLPPSNVRERIHAIGETEFDEVRFVLRQDDVLLPPEDDAAAYIEFAATFLELRAFSPHAIATVFPALEDVARVEKTLRTGLDDQLLLERSRPVNAPFARELAARAAPPTEQVLPAPTKTSAHAHDTVVSPRADRARRQGNLVRSMLLRVHARGTESAVLFDLSQLMERLARALGWPDAPIEPWARTLLPLLHGAATARLTVWNTEARLLYDLQKVCVAEERELFTLGAVEWALSLGKRPLRRPLPAQRVVRMVRLLDEAIAKLPNIAIAEPARGAIVRLLRSFRKRAEHKLRTTLGPKIDRALDEVGLRATNIAERISRKKLVEELLDEIVSHGIISLSRLRDSLSRSNVKMQNLELSELGSGDALLRADKLLSISLDGVYRRGEFYLRGLQKLSSLPFGTFPGRLLTLYVLLPVLSAFVLLEGLQHTVGLGIHKLVGGKEPEFVTTESFVVATVAIFALIHSERARRFASFVMRLLGTTLQALFIHLPSWVLARPVVQALLKSDPVVFFRRLVLKPLLLSLVMVLPLWVIAKDRLMLLLGLVSLFIAWNLVLNSKLGMVAEEAVTDWVVRRWRLLRRRLLPGLFGLIAAFFRRVLELVDRFIYSVDEVLTFRQGEGRVSLAVKASVGVVWFFVTYLIRIYVNLLFEPEVNPIKHVPVVTVAAKIMIPITPMLHEAIASPLRKLLGGFLAESIAAPTVFLLPGFFGFLVWELKENWRLYRMNRNVTLAPLVIGAHGETMSGFLKPGLHSGTVPKLYSKLRRATLSRDRAALKHRELLNHVEESIHCFAEREIVPLLGGCAAWRGGPLSIGHVDVASNRIRIELVCPELARGEASEHGVRIAFEEQSGWLVGSIAEPGFLEALEGEQRVIFENLLAGFYKLVGVEIVREQLLTCVGNLPYDIADEGLVVWPDASYRTRVVYDLRARGPVLPAQGKEGLGILPPVLDTTKVFFRDQKILWEDWVLAWVDDPRNPKQRLVQGPSLLGWAPAKRISLAPNAPARLEDTASPTVRLARPPLGEGGG